jgi:hypothetical protein
MPAGAGILQGGAVHFLCDLVPGWRAVGRCDIRRNLATRLLIENSSALRDAPVIMDEAAPGMGSRSRIYAKSNGVLIRNINLQDLIAVSYGVVISP